jgi:fructose-bisphosphate aldolase class II
MKNLKYYFKKALKGKWAIGQFNFSNVETLKAIIQAAEKLKSPVILGTSEGESRFFGLEQAVALVGSYREKVRVPLFLNLDHGRSFSYIKMAVDAGYDAVHFDGSGTSLFRNIRTAKRVVGYARRRKVLIEGEVGAIGEALGRKGILTDSLEAERFISETGVDSLAVAVGNLHGVRLKGVNPKLDLKRLKEIKRRVGSFPLVLHGGSGTPKKDTKEVVKSGIVKVNINTDLRLAYTRALKKALKKKPRENTPYKYLPAVVVEVQKVVEEKIKLFGSVNKI